MGADEFVWESPDGDTWTLDRTHFPRPLCRFSQVNRSRWFQGMGRGFEAIGLGIGGRENHIVNGWDYSRRPPLTANDIAAREPAALAVIARRPWPAIADRWYTTERARLYNACREFQGIDPVKLDDEALLSHLTSAYDLHLAAADTHFEHIALFAAVGEFMLACEAWGARREDAVAMLQGASPASAAARKHVRGIGDAVKAAGVKPQTLDDVRSAGPAAADALDGYLEEYGWRIVSGFDVTDVTLHEMPDAIVASIVAGLDEADTADDSGEVLAAGFEVALPDVDRRRFRELFELAQVAYGVRDDDVGALMWARGLVRRALLVIGSRLAASGRLHDALDVFDATLEELEAMVRGGEGPSADKIREWRELRGRQEEANPPPFIGPPPSPPDLAAMPPAVREVTSYFLAYAQMMFLSRGEPMKGFGIGATAYQGTARVVRRAEDALDRLEPGDVLVTTMTTPAFNTVLPIAGALVVEEGGLLSHAGITARELGLPAVIGVVNVMSQITDGDTVAVDPVAGTVEVLDRAKATR